MRTQENIEKLPQECREMLEAYAMQIASAKRAGDVPHAAHARHEIKGYINALTDLGVIDLPHRRWIRSWYASGRPEQILKQSERSTGGQNG
ncbi:MAG: hypothetical protein II907_00010 [Firmicutes bacterium]|nr:hypothetical protein [Bacillota bacterium]